MRRAYIQPSLSNPTARDNPTVMKHRRQELMRELAEAQAAREAEMKQAGEIGHQAREWYITFVKRMLIQDMKKGDGYQDIPWVSTREESEYVVTNPYDYLQIFEEAKSSVEKLYGDGGCTEDEMLMEIAGLSENYVKARAEFVGSLGWFWMQFCILYQAGQGYHDSEQYMADWALRCVCQEWGIYVRVIGDNPYMIAYAY